MITVFLTKDKDGQLLYRYSKAWSWERLPVQTIEEAEIFFTTGKDRASLRGQYPKPKFVFTDLDGEEVTHFAASRLENGSISIVQNANKREAEFIASEMIWSDFERLTWIQEKVKNLPYSHSGSALTAIAWLKANEPGIYNEYLSAEKEQQERHISSHAEAVSSYFHTKPVIEFPK